MRENVFLHPGEEIARAVQPVADLLEQMGGVLPASEQSDADSYYARAGRRSARSTQKGLLKRTSFVLVLARGIGWTGVPLTVGTVVDLHAGIFAPLFGRATLGLRAPPGRHEHRDDDGVEYPIWVVAGKGCEPTLTTRRGARSGQVERRLRETCADFERAAPTLERDLDGGAVAIARLYVRLIRIHPFGDGNGRTAWGIVQFAAGRLKLPFVQSAPTMSARVALGDAIRHGNRLQPLAEEIKRATWPEA